MTDAEEAAARCRASILTLESSEWPCNEEVMGIERTVADDKKLQFDLTEGARAVSGAQYPCYAPLLLYTV